MCVGSWVTGVVVVGVGFWAVGMGLDVMRNGLSSGMQVVDQLVSMVGS